MTTSQTLALLRKYESRNITFMESDGSWPIVWKRAKGTHVWDANGKKYLDLTAAFGVAAAGHANKAVIRAGQRQMAELLHAMGDVHPHSLKAQLARELSRLTFERWTKSKRANSATGKTIFCNSGFEAVEAALKTSMLATKKPGVIAFTGAYHGLGYGALNAVHRQHFRSPFRNQLRGFGHFAPYPRVDNKNGPPPGLNDVEKTMQRIFRRKRIGAVLVEPIQARAGVQIPPAGFLPLLRQLCDEHKALLVIDEIYTGLGRTGKWFACEHASVVPDVICLGKALTGGFPLSACVGRADVMDAAWPASDGEAIHTSTFLGHPVGCAMALAQIQEINRLGLVQRSAQCGHFLKQALSAACASSKVSATTRCVGLMAGVELRSANGSPATALTLNVVKSMLQRGFILLPEGEHSNVIGFTPPLTISKRDLERTAEALRDILTTLL